MTEPMEFTANCLNLTGEPDESGDIFGKDCIVHIPDVIPVTDNFRNGLDQVLGEARLKRYPTYLEARIVITQVDHVVAKSIMDKVPVYPCIGGKIIRRDRDNSMLITEVEIDSIGLSASGNVDKTIPPLIFGGT